MSKENPFKRFWDYTGQGRRDLWDWTTARPGAIAQGTKQVLSNSYNGSLDLLSEMGRNSYRKNSLPNHTSWTATEFIEGDAKSWRESGHLAVSLPMVLKAGPSYFANMSPRQRRNAQSELRIPASKDNDMLKGYDPEFPQMIMHFEDPLKNFTGEEAIIIEPRGRITDLTAGENTMWKMWMPGKFVVIGGNGNGPITKTQAELTPIDIANFLSKRIAESSNDQVLVYPDQILAGLEIMMKKSKSLEGRWNILKQHLEFQKLCLVEYPYQTAFLVYQMLHPDLLQNKAEISSFVQDMGSGAIATYSQFVKRVGEIPNLVFNQGGALIARALLQGQSLLPAAQDEARFNNMPPEFLVSVPGIMYFVESIKYYKTHLEPRIALIAKASGESQKQALDLLRQFKLVEAEGWKAGSERLKAFSPKIQAAIADVVADRAKVLEQQMAGYISGNTQLGVASPSTAPIVPQQGNSSAGSSTTP